VLLDLLLPARCVVCRTAGTQLCEPCARAFPRLRPPLCARCGAPTAWPVRRCAECTGRRPAFAEARAAVVYDRGVPELVHAWKERGVRGLAAAAADLAAEVLEPPRTPLTFVASDPERLRVRGRHPAEALARELGRRWDVPVLPLLGRAGGRRQRGLPLADRRANVRGAFTSAPAPARITLVDDVYTSGATVDAAASALRRAGAREVRVATFARAPRGYYSESPASTQPEEERCDFR
jgi:predicted amidophosphoribosyltransferase